MAEQSAPLIDSHCHLPLIDDPASGMDGVIERARANGVIHMLCVSVDLESFHGVLHAARRYDCVSATVGVHPNTDDKAADPTVEDLVSRADDRDIVAIGETGLDYFRSEGNLDWQRNRFRVHIRAARESGKPLVIHCREAATDLLEIMREEGAAEAGGVMHCFVEDWDTAQAAMDLGFFISLSGIVTFKSADELRAVARRLPLDRLLVETDAPWLAPVPCRGKQNEPALVAHTAACIAALRDMDAIELADATTANYQRLFGAPKESTAISI